MEDISDIPLSALVDAKIEYTRQLTTILSPLIFEGFSKLFDEAVDFKENTKDPRFEEYSELQIFQDYLRKIPGWNQLIIDEETHRIVVKSKCDWLEDLIAAVFISNAKTLSVIRIRNPDKQVKLKIPKLKNFVHKCYIECSRELYKNVYLFDNEEITTIEKNKNIRDIMSIIKEGIGEAVRNLMPYKDILRTYIGKVNDETENTMSTETGFEEELYKDFAKNKLRKSIEEIDSDEEIVPKQTIKIPSSESSEESRQEESKQEESESEESRQEEQIESHIEEQHIQEMKEEIQNLDEMIKISTEEEKPLKTYLPPLPEPLPQEPVLTAEDQILKTILNKAELIQENKSETTNENHKKISDKNSSDKNSNDKILTEKILNERNELKKELLRLKAIEDELRKKEENEKDRNERKKIKEQRHNIVRKRNDIKKILKGNKEEESSINETQTQTNTKSQMNGYSSEENGEFSFGGPVYNEEREFME